MPLLRLAWRYVRFHWVRSLLLLFCVALTAFIPVAVQLLVGSFSTSLRARAESTPLVVGAPGSRFDLVLRTLYYRGRVPVATSMAEVDAIVESGKATAVPILSRHTAQSAPLVGTTPEYFTQRGLRPARGTLPLVLGDVVLGADVAEELRLVPGDELLTDREGLFQFSLKYPLRLAVVGVLAPSESADDDAVFVDIKTTWIIDGVGHGHEDAATSAKVLRKDGDEVVLDPSIKEHTKITPDNIDSFHFHGASDTFPVTGILVWPNDARSSTILKGRFRTSKTVQALVPTEVVNEVLGFVFQLKRFFDANVLFVSVATVLFLALVVLLTLRARRKETRTLFKIGCSRGRLVALHTLELGICVLGGLFVAALSAWVLFALVLRDAVP